MLRLRDPIHLTPRPVRWAGAQRPCDVLYGSMSHAADRPRAGSVIAGHGSPSGAGMKKLRHGGSALKRHKKRKAAFAARLQFPSCHRRPALKPSRSSQSPGRHSLPQLPATSPGSPLSAELLPYSPPGGAGLRNPLTLPSTSSDTPSNLRVTPQRRFFWPRNPALLWVVSQFAVGAVSPPPGFPQESRGGDTAPTV